MYYVSWINEYPIYEPAEGGYYYEGETVVSCRAFRSWKKAKKQYLKWKRAFVEHYTLCYDPERIYENPCTYRKQGPFVRYIGKYVGTGAMVQITRYEPKNKGRVPYC